MSSAFEVNEKTVRDLPKWAQVAFVARCARRVLPFLSQRIFEDAETDLSDVDMTNADRAVFFLEEYAAHANSNPLSSREAEISRTAQTLLDKTQHEHPSENRRLVAEILMLAVAALDVPNPAEEIVDAAKKATALMILRNDKLGPCHEIEIAQSVDCNLLATTAQSEGWDDRTPVPREFFGPVWLNAPPDGLKATEKDSENSGLTITIDVPEGVTDEDVLALVESTVTRADALHRAYGGHGLAVEMGQIDIEQSEMAPVGGRL